MPVNWGLEIFRWQLSLRQEGLHSWSMATQQVLAGCTLNWLLPFTTGEWVMRLNEATQPLRRSWLILFNRALMLAFTCLLGGYGLYTYGLQNRYLWLTVATPVMILGFLVWLSRSWRGLSLTGISASFVAQIILLSVLRYAVFTLQFYLLLDYFLSALPMTILLAGVGWIFLFRSLIPSLFGNLGIREASALVFFNSYPVATSDVLTAALLIWSINSVLPALVGLYFIARIRLNIAS